MRSKKQWLKKLTTFGLCALLAAGVGTVAASASGNGGQAGAAGIRSNVQTASNVVTAYGDVKLDRTATTLGAGESVTLKATVESGGISRIVWSSSNTSVVSVSGGKITAKKTGTAVITAKTSGGKSASCKVTVKPAPASISLTKGMVTLGVGEKFTVGSAVNDGAGCATRTYRTSNSGIVRMTRTDWQGDMVAVKPGVAYVTVKTYNGKESTCKVTVKAAPSSVAISKGILSLGVGETYKLTSSIPTNTGAATRTFRTSNSSVVKMTRTSWEGEFKAMRTGVAYVTVRLYNGKESTCKVTVKPAPSSVRLSKTSMTLTVGQKGSLSAIIPDGTAASKRTFQSSNSNVVKMTRTDWQGEFVARAPGVAYVTVTLYNGKQANCKVTVKPRDTKAGFNKVANYLKSKGKKNSDGNYSVESTWNNSDNTTDRVVLSYSPSKNAIALGCFTTRSDINTSDFDQTMTDVFSKFYTSAITLSYNSLATADVSVLITEATSATSGYYGGYMGKLTPATYTRDQKLSLSLIEGQNAPSNPPVASSQVSKTIKYANIILQKAGLSIKDLGFDNY